MVLDIDQAYASFEQQMAALEQGDSEQERVLRIRERADTIIANIEALERETSGVFELTTRREALQLELTEVRASLDDALAPAIDDQLFFALTGYRSLTAAPAPREEHLSEGQFVRYRRLAELQADVNIATELLANAFTLPDASLIEPLQGTLRIHGQPHRQEPVGAGRFSLPRRSGAGLRASLRARLGRGHGVRSVRR